mmetsp:Transcript_28919/g.93233  ORF Transcript_28919/g.93233 Transcript_28919/m.93233 type:complete len:96 (-) Transcript_28919:133-420(-)
MNEGMREAGKRGMNEWLWSCSLRWLVCFFPSPAASSAVLEVVAVRRLAAAASAAVAAAAAAAANDLLKAYTFDAVSADLDEQALQMSLDFLLYDQ